jgi:hypothetical protein
MPGYSDIEDTMLSFEAYVYLDITNTELNDGQRILYLHGGLHLVRLPSGETRKLIAKRSNILDQFGKALERG